MNRFQGRLVGLGLLVILASGLWIITETAEAGCTGTIDGTANTLTCDTNLGGTNALGGDDTITINGSTGGFLMGGDDNDTFIMNSTVSGGSAILGESGNDTFNNNGTVLGGSGISGGSDDDTITNSGAFSGRSGIGGGIDDDAITNSGAFSGRSGIYGDAGNDTITNSGAFSSESGISGGNDDDTLTNSGIFSGGSIINGGAGNDTITLLPGSAFDVTSYVDGGSHTTQDILILHSTVLLTIPDITPCQGGGIIAGCFVPWEGGVLYFVNFEQIQVVLIQILQEQGIDVSVPAVPTVICEDGRVKVFKLPNGDVEYYSGFDVRPTNGFLVGKVTLAEIANGSRTFSDPNALGWSVVISQNGNALSGQVFDNLGNPVGNTCRH